MAIKTITEWNNDSSIMYADGDVANAANLQKPVREAKSEIDFLNTYVKIMNGDAPDMYDSSLVYNIDHIITYGNKNYTCIQDNTISQTPDTATAYWSEIDLSRMPLSRSVVISTGIDDDCLVYMSGTNTYAKYTDPAQQELVGWYDYASKTLHLDGIVKINGGVFSAGETVFMDSTSGKIVSGGGSASTVVVGTAMSSDVINLSISNNITSGGGTASTTTFTPTGSVTSTDVQAAIAELDSDIQNIEVGGDSYDATEIDMNPAYTNLADGTTVQLALKSLDIHMHDSDYVKLGVNSNSNIILHGGDNLLTATGTTSTGTDKSTLTINGVNDQSAAICGINTASSYGSGVMGKGNHSAIEAVLSGNTTADSAAFRSQTQTYGHGIHVVNNHSSMATIHSISQGDAEAIYAEGDIHATGTNTPFTAGHIVFHTDTPEVGDLLSVELATPLSVQNTVVESVISNSEKDVKVYGVFVKTYPDLENMLKKFPELYTNGVINPEHQDYIDRLKSEEKISSLTNSIGEGMINVCDKNGDIVVGDYITSSVITGKGQKQDDDLLHNYTVAKSLQDVDFTDAVDGEDGFYIFEDSMCKMIGCTYHCS